MAYQSKYANGAAVDAALDLAMTAVQPADVGTASSKNAPASGDAGTDEVVLGNDSRLTDARTPILTTEQSAALNSGITSYDVNQITKNKEALKHLVDDGPKNRIKIGVSETEKQGVTFTPNGDGTITVNGTNTGSGTMIAIFDLYAQASSSTANKQDPFIEQGSYILKGTGNSGIRVQAYGYNDDLTLNVLANSSSDAYFEVDGTYQYYVFRIWVGASAAFDNFILRPMCCLQEFYEVSTAFKPYLPSNSELYDMIKSLQT